MPETTTAPSYRRVVVDLGLVLIGRCSGERIAAFGGRHLAVGLLCTWLVGIGRYWDAPRADPWQIAGLGSVVYVFALSTFIWLLGLPLRPLRWRWRIVLTYVTLTSPPALLYAIPVERFMSMGDATSANFWFLALVALWRVVLMVVLLVRYAGFRPGVVVVMTLVPLASIVVTLASLNLERAVFAIMGGLRDRTANDAAYLVVLVLAWLSRILTIPLIVGWLACWRLAHVASCEGRPNPLVKPPLPAQRGAASDRSSQ